MLRLGVDTGGTFTDFVLLSESGWRVHKVPSTPGNPAQAILDGIRDLLGMELTDLEVVHGTTVGTNAFLERRGARVALLTTQGFEDVLFIGRQTRPQLFKLAGEKPLPLLSRSRCLGVKERLRADGSVVVFLEDPEIEGLKKVLRQLEPEALAICLLHSYINPAHEEKLAAGLHDLDCPCSLSIRIMPEFREYERTSTTVINAYLGPIVNRYLEHLQRQLQGITVFMQQSNGGLMPAARAGGQAIHTILSGPAGGVNAAWSLSLELGEPNLLTFDMGGTSTDVALLAGAIPFTQEYSLDDYPIGIPVIDIHTVGAGGGSIAFRDRGGALQVGPQSAGADPGPVCYGRGSQAVTVTDAHLFLGRLLPDFFLGGRIKLEAERARQALEKLAADFAVSPVQLAQGIIRVANSHMAKALRAVSLERGYDPRDFTLCCFGGAGGLHVCDLARDLGIRRIIVPPQAGVLSALGMALAHPRRDFARTILFKGKQLQPKILEQELLFLQAQGWADLSQDGVPPEQVKTRSSLEVRYQGQNYTLNVPFGPNFINLFHQRHAQAYGHSFPERPVEVTTLRLHCQAASPFPSPLTSFSAPISPLKTALPTETEVWLEEGCRRLPLFYRHRLLPNQELPGPSLVLEDSATLLILPGFSGRLDKWGNLHLQQ